MIKKYLVTYFYYITGVTFGFDNFFFIEKPGEDIYTKDSILTIQENILKIHPTYNAARVLNIIPLHDEIPAEKET